MTGEGTYYAAIRLPAQGAAEYLDEKTLATDEHGVRARVAEWPYMGTIVRIVKVELRIVDEPASGS